MRNQLSQIAILVLGFGLLSFGQIPEPWTIRAPDGDGTWAIYVTTGGGFTGQGRGSATVTSQGHWNCPQVIEPCANRLADDKLGSLKKLVAGFDLKKWRSADQSVMTPSLCSDCFTTQVTFARREKGNVEIFTLSWDDASQRSAPPEAVRIVEMALTGKW